ncbi:MFS transporter [Luteipulveratus halotolerans]|uniref:MFS transporter n=1 Tax=Luteipulveratus halotolerans TaxID=1631356 RepID=A0A0L6CMV1_9MICO|nr:MFS transporter [Luteipulveratus halotolerans]KNX38878.1 MFS transporter [Luteipulveratus halotolerans]
MTTRDESRAFWTYWAASATSSLGSAFTAIALPLTAVLILDATPFEMGVVAAAGYVAWIVIGLPAGPIVQRLPLRATQVAIDLARAGAIATLPIAWWLDALTLAHVVAVALVISFANVIFDVANFTFLPRVVPKEQLQSRNSLMSGTQAASQLGGPSLGGLAVQLLGAVPTLLIDAASYVASAVLLRTLPDREPEAESDDRPGMRAMIREGWDFVVHHPIMGPCMWSATAINFTCGGQVALFAYYLVHVADAPSGLVGFLLAAEGVGSLVGAALVPAAVRVVGSARLCVVGGLVSAAAAFVIPVGSGWGAWVAFALGNIVFAGGVVVFSTTTRTYRQIATPPDLLSRVMATVRFVSWGAIPVGGLVAGALGGWLGARTALFVFAALTLLSPLILMAGPIRHLRDFPDQVATEREREVSRPRG